MAQFIRTMLIVGLLSSLAGCMYTADLRGFDVSANPPQSFANKRVAIMINSQRVQDGHSTNTDIYSYKFTFVRDALTDGLKKHLGGVAKEVVVVTDGAAPRNFDFYIYPQARLKSVHAFWTMGCQIDLKMDLKDSTGRTILQESAEGRRDFFFPSRFDERCREAMSEVFATVAAGIFGKT